MYLDAFAEAFARHWLDPLPDYDRECGTALVTTLAIYLEHSRGAHRRGRGASIH